MGQKCLIIGGGYTAVDCARTLVRLGVPDVVMVYRGTPQDITLDSEEMHFLEVEDVTIRYLTTVASFIPGKHGKLDKVGLVRTKVQQDHVTLIHESKRLESFDTAIICIGQAASSSHFIPSPMKQYFKNERLLVDGTTFMSRQPGLFGTGDYVNRSRSIIDAVADGRRAALGVHAYLTGETLNSGTVDFYPADHSDRGRTDDFIPRQQEKIRTDLKSRHLKTEINLGFDRSAGLEESKRCYLCNLHYEINIDNCIYCMRCIDEAPIDCIKMVKSLGRFEDGKRPYAEAEKWNEIGMIYIDNDLCVRCGKCLDVCPTRCISVTKYRLSDPVFGDSV
jgi:ferredoxin